jgi:glycosyltransferase involved in cell wall biosynthesis
MNDNARRTLVNVDVVCSVYNGGRFLPELLRSLEDQTHADWRLWVRDDGSCDDSVGLVRRQAASDQRVHFLTTDETARLGATQSFAWLLQHVPADSAYVMFADQDDVWLPRKIEQTLAAMQAAEVDLRRTTPILVHTDLVVADESLNTVHPSFWQFARLQPEPVSLRRLAVQNNTTGAATMINRALLELVGIMPREAAYHDWWCAMAAAAFGRVIPVPVATVLYRQHSANAVGARDARIPWIRLPSAIASRIANASPFRFGLRMSAAQAGAFLERYGPQLSSEDRAFLCSYAALPRQRLIQRKLDLLRLRTLPEHGLLQTLGILLRG